MNASLPAILASAADEGKNVILSMLVVGLVFLAVIALGELNSWRVHRKQARRSPYR